MPHSGRAYCELCVFVPHVRGDHPTSLSTHRLRTNLFLAVLVDHGQFDDCALLKMPPSSSNEPRLPFSPHGTKV
jgi:hypothetical protein